MADASVLPSTYRAFISYSHRDKAWADWLHRALETWRVPSRLVGTTTAHGTIPRRLNPVFRDREELASATDLDRKVNEALAQSDNLIVICSPAAATSRWVNAEVLAYKRLGRTDRIFCLIVAGEPDATDLPGRAAEECFCPALRFRLDAQGQPTTERAESIAADARPGKDGKANAKLKLIAGMLDVGFDALKQREQHRRMARMTAITALALVVMTVTSALAVAALVSRQRAEVAQQTAERRQKQAEGLIGFMLGDLSEKLDQMQRLDIIQRVNDKAMAYFTALPPADVGDTSLTQRAKALEQIGIVRMGSGNPAGALEAFAASIRLSARLAAAAPDDVARQVAYSRTLAFTGLVYWNQNKLDASRRAFETTRPTLARLAAPPRADASARFQLAQLDNNLGHVLEALGHTDAAAPYYRERLRLSRELVAAKPRERDYQAALGSAHNDLGRLALQRGDLLAAIDEYRASDAIQGALWQADRNDNLQRQDMLEARAILGRTLALAGDNDAGTRLLAEAITHATRLAQLEAGNVDFRVDLALYSTQLARLHRLAGDTTTASTLVARASGLFDGLTRQDPANAEWRKYAAETRLEQAALAWAGGDRASAQGTAGAALQQLATLRRERPGDADALRLAATATLQLAHMERGAAARSARAAQALQDLRTAPDHGDLRLAALQVEALLLLGRVAEAQPVLSRLNSAGYRDGALLDVLARARLAYPPDPAIQARLQGRSPQAALTPNIGKVPVC